jgi:hypothetical protein
MKSGLSCVLTALLAFACCKSMAALTEDDDPNEAEKLLRQSEVLTDIRSPGSHSFRLTALVRIFDEKGHAQDGTYDLQWKSPTAWRDELRNADFSQVRIANTDKLFVSRKPVSVTLGMFQLLNLLTFPDLIRFSPEAAGQKLQIKVTKGSSERALEIAYPGYPSRKVLVIGAQAPLPERLEYKGSHFKYEFRDFVEFSGHQFPRNLIQFDSNKPQIEVDVQELTEATFDASFLDPPPDARWLNWCQHPKPAKLSDADMKKVSPIPWPLRNGALKTPLEIYGIIGTDGQWHNLTVLKSAGKEVDSYWIEALRQQQYSPAKCGERPVEQESVRKFWML